MDTAGLHASDDPVEQAGMQRTRAMLAQADRVLLVIDDQAGFTSAAEEILAELPIGVPHTRVFNKVDLSGRVAGLCSDEAQEAVAISAHTAAGVNALRAHLKTCAGYSEQSDGGFSARRRHLDALQQASQLVTTGIQQLQQHRAGELLAEELRQAQQVLGEITGAVSSDDLLGRIFSSFCIGK
jgi:tRNA modification GTPase